MGKNLICIPYAYDPKKKSGVNVSGNDTLNIYMMNACTALISAKRHNSECDVALITNLEKDAVPAEYCELLEREHVLIYTIPYDDFVFSNEYTWSLAFYKLCILKNIYIR